MNYWICQIAGWLTLALADTPLDASFRVVAWRALAPNLLQCAVGLAYTHILRNVARRWSWIALPLRTLIPTIVLATLTVAIVWHLTVLTMKALLFPGYPYPRMLLDIGFGTAFGESAVILLWSLLYFGYHFFQRYRDAEIEKWKLEAAVKDAELRALKAQMNPHFIFNCLNSIRALIHEDPARAGSVVTSLASILRYAFQSGGSQTVPLETELRIIDDYLALESIRFEGRLRPKLRIDPRSLAIGVPPMLVQTLVENGIKYGIATIPEGGELEVRSSVDGDRLVIHIVNSGQLAPEIGSTGVGLRNARERLKLLFGDDASITLVNSSPRHVTTEVTIPLPEASP